MSEKKDRLLLLAKHFPYNRGNTPAESYLADEIVYLAEQFSEVLAVGTEASSEAFPSIRLPDNVRALALNCPNNINNKAIYTINGLLNNYKDEDLISETLETEKPETITQAIFRGYFISRAERKYYKLVNCLKALQYTPDVIYSFWLYDTALVTSWLTKVFPSAVTISRAHGYDLYEERNALSYLPCRDYLLSKLDCVLACSAHGADYMKARYPSYRDRIMTSYLGTSELPDRRHESQETFFKIVSCSRVEKIKRVDFLARALALLDKENVMMEWTHFGDGSQFKEVQHIVSNYRSIRANLKGMMDHEQIIETYGSQHFDLFVNVSSSEGLPISIMEACGVGIPVLATDVGGTSEIVKDGANGYLIKADITVTDLAHQIMKIIKQDQMTLSKMRESSRLIWSEKFRVESNVLKMINALDKIRKR